MKEKPTIVSPFFFVLFSANPRVYIGSKNCVILVIDILLSLYGYRSVYIRSEVSVHIQPIAVP